MSRTRRYVPHWVIEDHLHPWIDPQTLEPYKWGGNNQHRQLRQERKDAARLRGDDGRYSQWRDYWSNRIGMIRTDYRRLINEGIEDHFDACEDEGKIFDFRGIEIDDIYSEMDQYYHDLIMDEYWDSLEEHDRLEREAEQADRDLDDYYDDYDYYDPYY